MRRSFGTPSGGILRTFRRAVRAGVTGDTYSHSSTSSNYNKSLSLSTTAPFSRPLLLSSSATIINDDFDWVSVNDSDNDNYDDDGDGEFGNVTGGNFVDDDVFGLVPSRDEVINAVSALQLAFGLSARNQNSNSPGLKKLKVFSSWMNIIDLFASNKPAMFLKHCKQSSPMLSLELIKTSSKVVDPTHCSQFLEDNQDYNLAYAESQENRSPSRLPSRVSSSGSESDWIEPSLHLCYPMMLEKHRSIRVYDALHLLQTEPSVKRMVVSLSSDKAVWEAVLNNKMVRKLRDSMSAVENREDGDDNNGWPERVTNIFSWVYEKTKVKMIEIIEKIVELVNELFQLSEVEKREESTTGKTKEMLQISLLLSIMVLVIVVVNRGLT